MQNYQKIMKLISDFIENGILSSDDLKKEINDLIDFEQSSFEDYSKSKSVSDNNKTFLLQPMIELETSSKILSEFEKYNKNLLTALEEAKNDWSSKLTELSNDWTSQYELINQIETIGKK